MLLVLILKATFCAQTAFAQTPEPPGPASPISSQAVADPQTAPSAREESPCPGCPPRRLGMAFLQVTFVNVLYEAANLARGQVTARITPQTWWTNMKRGWEWDLDDFTVNQIGHPYQGNNYFTTGRANGLDFWESAALTAFGSGTWEYFGETNQASLNDFINTTLGGIALGEMFHRAAWLVRDTQATGRSRLLKEIAAAAIDPMTGYNRFRSGAASRVEETPEGLIPTRLGSMTSIGAAWRGSNTSDKPSTVHPLAEVDLLYGNLETGHSDVPYEGFGVRLAFGGGSTISEARVRGRLFGEPFRGESAQLTFMQGYQYNKNAAYQFGAQSFDVNVGVSRQLTSRTSLWATGWGGLTILGAVDSVPLEGSAMPEEPPAEDAGQGVSTGPRDYDYGPGGNFGGFVTLKRGSRNFFILSYEAHHLHVLDGVRANHLLQRARADLNVPLRGRLGVSVTGEFFDRRTYYQAPGVQNAHFHFPQFRLSMTWSSS